jgi:ribonuclease HI
VKWAKCTTIYTDGSKCPTTGRAAYAVFIPSHKIIKQQKLPNDCSVFTAELLAIKCSLEIIIQRFIPNAVILTDSLSSLQAIESHKSTTRPEVIDQIYDLLAI